MIFAQYNSLRFYSDKKYRQWENTENQEEHIVFFELNYVTPFQLIVNTSSSATFDIVNAYTEQSVVSGISITISYGTGYSRLKYNGTTLSGGDEVQNDGYYYIKITNGAYTYYSDVFAWTSNETYINQLIKIEASSADFYMGINDEYSFEMTGITYISYYNVFEYLGVEPSVEENANEENGIVKPYFTSLSMSERWNINGTKHIFKYLHGLRVLQQNGQILVTYKGETFEANDIVVEQEEMYNEFDLVDIAFSIRPSNDVMSVNNDV